MKVTGQIFATDVFLIVKFAKFVGPPGAKSTEFILEINLFSKLISVLLPKVAHFYRLEQLRVDHESNSSV